jgi:hypothetical protein
MAGSRNSQNTIYLDIWNKYSDIHKQVEGKKSGGTEIYAACYIKQK